MRSNARPQKQQHARKLTAITAIVSVIAGAFVAGISAQMASANSWTPSVSVESVDPSGAGKDFVLAEENVGFDVAVSNTSGGRQFNLSLMAMVPASVSFVSGGEFGAPTIFTEGQVLPNRTRTATTDLPSCTDLGLVAAPTGSAQPQLCAVPAGQQVWVWSNVNDLPQGATVPSTITIAPASDAYPVGSRIDFSIRAFTSDDPARLPTFDGSTSVSRTADHTSGTGFADDDVPVKALRVTKSEPSAEDERLRGAHGEPTVYTVTVQNTRREATLGATVTDYLPAGIEYLGDGTTVDNSAPGAEYPTAPRLAGGAIDGETVETVSLTEAQALALGLSGAGVYTKVTWLLGDLAADETRTLQYRAVVPLFANAQWAAGTAPSAESGAQAANLDNNTGASTRHGATDAPATAQTFRNVASVVGTYQGPVFGGDESLRSSSDDDDEIIEAVDVRVLKSVDSSGLFSTGSVAVYSMQVDVSEYVDASDIILTDVIPNGLCPALPAGEAAATLMIDGATVTSERWNSEVPGEACNYPTTASGAVLSDDLTVVSIDYDRTDGTFTVVFSADDLVAGETMTGRYSVMQRPNYSGASGGTSSGDSFVNRVTVTAQTDPIAAIANDPALSARVGGARLVSDDSAAIITSGFTGLTKTVLERGSDLTTDPEAWVKDAVQPFSPGDSVWYRIEIPFAKGIDIRNPELVDYLPEGVALQEVRYAYTGFPAGASTTTPVAYG